MMGVTASGYKPKAPTWVATFAAYASTAVVSRSVSITSTVPVGDFLIACTYSGTSTMPDSITDTQGNVYTQAYVPNRVSAAVAVVWVCRVTTQLTSADVVTLTMPVSQNCSIEIQQYSGLAAQPVDVGTIQDTQDALPAVVSSGTASQSISLALLVVCVGAALPVSDYQAEVPAGWTFRGTGTTNRRISVSEKIISSAQALTETITVPAATNNADRGIVLFKAS
jgi:hypothetical protein